MKGLITKSTGSWYSIRTENGRFFQGRLAGKIRLDGRKSTNPVVVGDWVEFNIDEKDDVAVIQEIFPRRNYIIRRSLNLSKQTHILAANIDQAILMATLVMPRTSTGFIDRFLVTCEAYSIPAILLFNKNDLLSTELKEIQQGIMEMYSSVGYTCYAVSSFEKDDVQLVKNLLSGKTTLVAGHSGVGKSTFINAMQPELNLKTGVISDFHLKGKHTTTFTELFELNSGGFIIDSPGIKELGLVEMKQEEVGHYFPEIRNKMNDCKFNNCRHENEPHCAVLKAVEEGEIHEERYINYLKMLNGDEMNWNDWD
jgi:ribosome biogenesis GTPase